MGNIYNKKIQSIEKKIKFLNVLLIVGIIILIIGILGLIITVIRINELQQELDKRESDMQRLSEINKELEEINIKNWIFMISLFIGPPTIFSALNYKRRFSKLKDLYLDQYKTHSELSLIIDLKED